MAGRHLVENPAKVSAANLADLARRETLAQHFRDGRVEESAGHAGPGGVGRLAGPGGQDVGVAADADVVAPLSCSNWRCRSPALVHLFHPLEVSFKEMCPFDRPAMSPFRRFHRIEICGGQRAGPAPAPLRARTVSSRQDLGILAPSDRIGIVWTLRPLVAVAKGWPRCGFETQVE